jgi:uncharacterized protein YajQ (UPF0234 family)
VGTSSNTQVDLARQVPAELELTHDELQLELVPVCSQSLKEAHSILYYNLIQRNIKGKDIEKKQKKRWLNIDGIR